MGNEVSRTAALKRVFQKLDADQQGVLTLDQILSVKKIPGVTHPISNSALLLLRFDESLEGAINFKEFRNLLDHIRNAELKAKGRKKKKRNKLRVWSAVSRDTVTKSELSRNTETPAWTGRKPHDSDSEESDEGSNNSSENDDSLTEDIEETLKHEAKAFFDKMIKSDEGREKFIQWLWRLADTDKNNLVAADELTCVLKALRADGINPENLVYENDDDIKTTDLSKKDQTIAKKLLEEFDKGQTGFLTQEEFTILADLILKNYEIKSEYESGDILGDYELKRRLGRGASGEVRLAVHHITGDRRAIKICPKGNIASLARLDTEIKAMLMLQHKHIVSLYEVLESEDNVFFVMELCGGGSLYEYMGNKPLSEDTARYYFSQIIEGVSYSHAMGVVHRDLKLDNLLLDNNANIKITDFGHAGIFQKGWDLFCTPTVGGLCHVAPEQLLGQPYSGEKNDIWGLGVILYILLVGALPFKGQAYLDNIRNGRYTIPEHLSPEVRDLISSMLVTDPNGRIGCKRIMKHPWLTMGKKDSPNLDRFQLPIQPEKAVWNLPGGKICALCNVLRDLEIVTLHLNDKPEAEKDKIRCHYPEKELKFYFKLKRDPQTNEQFFRFKLAEGESRDFLGIIPKIRMAIEEAERNLQSGTTSSKNTIQMRLGTKKATKKNLEVDKETSGNKDDKEKASSKRDLRDNEDKDEKDTKDRKESKRNLHEKDDKDHDKEIKDKKDSKRTLDSKHDKDRDSVEEVRSSKTIPRTDKDHHDREVHSEKISKRATMDERLLDKSREIDKLKETHEDKPMSSVISKKSEHETGSGTSGSKRALERSREIERPKDKLRDEELRGSKSDKPRRRKTKRASKRSVSSESSESAHSTSESIGSSSGSRRDGDRD